MRLYILTVLIIGLFTFVASSVSFASVTQIDLDDNATGGDCTNVGNWDNTNKICTLTQNVTDSHFSFNDSNLTLDCDGYMVTGMQTAVQDGHGIPAIFLGAGPPTHVTVKNCHIKNFCGAIEFIDSSNNHILNNTFEGIFREDSTGCTQGVVLIDDDYDVISGNEINNADLSNIILLRTDNKSGINTHIFNNKIFDVDATDVIDVDCRAGGAANGTAIEQNLIDGERGANDGIETTSIESTCNNISILRNRILNMDLDCIETEGTNLKVNYNLCQFIDTDAFEVETSDSEYKYNVLVHTNLDDDFDGNPDECDAPDEDHTGAIEIDNGSHGNEFSYNTIRSAICGSGILIEADSDNTVIKHNRIYGNHFNGIFIFSSDAEGTEIKYNKIYNNGLDGVRNDGTNTEIDDNMIRNNGEYGVDCSSGTTSSISGNKGKGGFLGFFSPACT